LDEHDSKEANPMATATVKSALRFHDILFATDFSPAAAHAIPYVKKIAKHFDANLVTLHVRPAIVNVMTEPGTWPADIEALKEEDDKHRKEVLETFAGIRTEVVLQQGNIQSCVDAAIKKHNTDLVVIGTRGRTGLGKILLGSVAEEILRSVSCPVLTVGPNSRASRGAADQIREILYATDFSPETQGASAYAVSLAEEFQSRLVLLHVIADFKAGDLVSPNEVMTSSESLLRKLVSPQAQAWCKPEYFVERGDPAEKILEFASLRETDLIVLGVRPEKGVPGASTHLPIATVHKVVAHATCPVLTIRH
jgi:nucleotide-binding universal stress UspA family protein